MVCAQLSSTQLLSFSRAMREGARCRWSVSSISRPITTRSWRAVCRRGGSCGNWCSACRSSEGAEVQFLPKLAWGGGPFALQMVEGPQPRSGEDEAWPSTTVFDGGPPPRASSGGFKQNARRDEPGGHPFLPRKVGNLTRPQRLRSSLAGQLAEFRAPGDIARVRPEVRLSADWAIWPVDM